MADTIDSISIELTASTQSAERSIQRVIDALRMLQAAAIDASAESRIGKSIRSIAKAAREVDSDAGQKLARLAGGLKALSKVGDLSNLADAGKNLSGVVRAVNSMGQSGGKGLSNLANGIKQTSDALRSIKDADVSKLNAVKDALSGEMSGSLHSSGVMDESAALGGMAALAQGAIPALEETAKAFGHIADQIGEATGAYQAFRAALGSGVNWTSGDAGDNGTWYADDIQNPAGMWRDIFDSFPRELTGQVGTIETEFVNMANSSEDASGHIRDGFAKAAERISHFIDAISNARTAYEHFKASLREVPVLGDVVKAFDKIRNAIGGFFQSVMRIARYRLIRSMIRTITEGFREGTKNLYAWSQAMDGRFASSMDRLATSTQYLKNSLGTLVGPLMEALEPALTWIIDRLVDVINTFNMFIAAISGRATYTAAVRAATSWGGAVSNAAGNASNAVSNAVDDMKRTIMGFDEINKLNAASDYGGGSGGSGGGGSSGGAGVMFEERPLSGGFQQFSNALELALQDTLSRITLIIGGAELAVGAILALSGANVPLGIALMATGAVTMASAIVANWDGIPDEIKLVIGAIEAAVGTALLAVGAILAFSHANVGLGIALLIAGFSLNFSAVTVVWTTLKDTLEGQIQAIGVLLGGATFGLGAILTFAAHPEIGIPMMIAGASVAAVAVNWNYIKEKLQGPIGAAVGIFTGTALIVLGILAILGANIPLGIGLIISGAGSLASVVAANWDNLTDFFEDLWTNIKTAAEETWDTLKEIGSGIWEKIKEGVTGAVKGVGGWIKEHIFQPFINAWNWLLGIFGGGGGDDSGVASNVAQVAANAAYGSVANGPSVADDIAEGTTDRESIQKLKKIGGTMGDAIKTGLNDRLKNISNEIWNTIINGWNAETRELPVSVTLSTNGSVHIPNNVEITVSLVKKWTGTALEALGLNNLSATVGIALSKTASELWNDFIATWNSAGNKILYFSPKLDNTAQTLYETFKKAWDSAGSMSLYFSPKLDNTAKVLWDGFKREWDAARTTLYASAKLDNTGAVLWNTLKREWEAARATLYASPKLDNTGAVLWNTLKREWEAARATLYASPKLDNTGTALWNTLKREWEAARTTLYASPKLDNTGTVLWNTLKREWEAARTTLYASPKLDNTGAVLWNTLKREWEAARTTLYASPKLDNTGAVLWNTLKREWEAARTILYASPKLDNTGAVLWNTLKREWEAARTTLYASPKLDNTGAVLWNTLKREWDSNKPTVFVSVVLEKSGWDTVTNYIDSSFGGATGGGGGTSGGGAGRNKRSIPVDVTLEKGWKGTATNALDLDNLKSDVAVNVNPIWKLLGFLVYLGLNNLSTTIKVNLEKNDSTWKTRGLSDWIGVNDKTVNINIYKNDYIWRQYGLRDWIGPNDKTVNIYLYKNDYIWRQYGLQDWIGPNYKSVEVNLYRGNWYWGLQDWIGNSVSVRVDLYGGGGVVKAHNGTNYRVGFADGGVITRDTWKHLPKMAGGGSRAHGTMFVAGEAGPEIVGHIGGRTEVLNQSQLAQTMFAAVRSAMSGVRIGGYIENAAPGGAGEADYEAMYRAMYDAFTDAMAGSVDRDREKVALMRQIAAKDFTQETTAAGINRAQVRANRRAGTTVVPVGT